MYSKRRQKGQIGFDFFNCYAAVDSMVPDHKTYWIVVILGNNWEFEKHQVVHVCNKKLTKYAIVSQPVFQPYYDIVNYAMFSFLRSVSNLFWLKLLHE